MFEANIPLRQSGSRKDPFLLLFFFFAGITAATAQSTQEVKGTVADSKGQPAIGVTVTIKGTNTRTLTDQTGTFTIKSAPSATCIPVRTGMHPIRIR